MRRAGGFIPRTPVGVHQERIAIFIVAGNSGVWSVRCVRRDHVQAKNADQNHANDRSREKKGLPAGLKSDSLHLRLPPLRART